MWCLVGPTRVVVAEYGPHYRGRDRHPSRSATRRPLACGNTGASSTNTKSRCTNSSTRTSRPTAVRAVPGLRRPRCPEPAKPDLPVRPDTIFDVARLTKVIAVWAFIGALCQDRALTLDDGLDTFWPEADGHRVCGHPRRTHPRRRRRRTRPQSVGRLTSVRCGCTDRIVVTGNSSARFCQVIFRVRSRSLARKQHGWP